MSAELAPCPFCGGKTAILCRSLGDGWGDFYLAQCLKCCAESSGSSNKAEAIAAWNRRTPPAMSADHIGEAQGWRDIATAPRDGRDALVYRPLARLTNDEPVAIRRLIGGDNYCYERTVPEGEKPCNPTDGSCHVTHWQPLPPPPSADAHPAPINPSGDTGELREKMKRAIWTQLPQEDANMGTSGRIADAILDLIQSERAG